MSNRRARSPDTYVLKLQGTLRVPLNGQLQEEMLAAVLERAQTVVLDLGQVTDIDAAGVGALVRTYAMGIAARRHVRIVNTRERVRQTLEHAGVYDLLSGAGGPV